MKAILTAVESAADIDTGRFERGASFGIEYPLVRASFVMSRRDFEACEMRLCHQLEIEVKNAQ